MTEASSKSKVPALDKGLDILELLAKDNTPQSIYDISRSLGRTRGEIYRVLNRLLDRGYVIRVGDQERVVLGEKLFRLAIGTRSTQHLIEVSAPVMEKVVRETGHSSFLSVRSGTFAVTIFNVTSSSRITMSSPIGSRMSLWETAPGIAMMGAMEQHEIDPIYELVEPEVRRELQRKLQHQRKEGYALVGGGKTDETCEVAVPFRRSPQRLDAAISAVLFRDRLAEARGVGSTLVAVAASN